MRFAELEFTGVLPPTNLPADLKLALPTDSQLPVDQQHFLLYIPWDDFYLELVPSEFKAFFKFILPYLGARTTDVHTAICSSYLDDILAQFDRPVNRRVVAIALFLHDSGWSQLSEEEIAHSLGVTGLKLSAISLGPKERHAVEGEKIARQILATYQFEPPLTETEIELIAKGILYHDKPEEVAGADHPMPLEIQALVDLDHIWSFTYQNFWQDTVRKGVTPPEYLRNLEADLDAYFVTLGGKALAKRMLTERAAEVAMWKKL